MAPSTRSKSGNLPVRAAKRLAQDSSDEDVDDNDTQSPAIKSKKRPAAKKTKVAHDDTDVKKAPSRRPTTRKTGTTTTRGGLKALPNMPLDVLEEIFCALDPASLVHISRTTKAFRQLLFSPGYAHVWREVFARDESDIPLPPDGMQAKDWAHLLFGGKICEGCHQPNAPTVLFHLRVRLCEDCIESTLHSTGWTKSFRSIGIQRLMPAEHVEKITSTERRGRYGGGSYSTYTATMYTFGELYEDFIAGQKAALSESPEEELKYLQDREATFSARYEHAEVSRKWQSKVLQAQERERIRRLEEVATVKKARKAEVEKRLKAKGYNTRDRKIMSGVWKLKGMNIAQPLTDEDWAELWPAIRGVVDGNCAEEDSKAAAKRRESRRYNVGRHYDRMLRTLDCVRPQEVQYFPRSSQCLEFDPLKSFVEQDAPDKYNRGWDDTTELDAALRETIKSIREMQTTHHISLYNMLVDGGHVSKKMSRDEALSLAKAVFRLGDLEHWRRSELRFGLEVMAEDRKDYRQSYSHFYDGTPVKVDDRGISIVRKLQGLLEMDDNATIRDMDAANGNFICMSCKPKSMGFELKKKNDDSRWKSYPDTRRVLSWRAAVSHVHAEHGMADADVDLRLLTKREQAALEAKYHDKYKVSHTAPICFGCCHCHDYWKDASKDAQNHRDGLMSKRDITKHLQTKHAIPAKKMREDVDFWYHPRFERGLLDSSITSFNLIEERA
ncbi:hypothetical protein PENSPDRAFT_648674 [Peniophora sp. CONT]|nr:hypothetical protein PENSPDRAFT_648674 [Peniophora sp. CONT]